MNMIEKREIIIRFANYMEYILDLELSETETLKRIEALI